MPGFNPEKLNIHDLTIEEPEKESELPFDPERDITKQAWQGMEAELKEHKNNNYWWSFSWQATGMKILAAKKVKVTDKGLEIVMREKKEDFRPEIPRMPEQRNF